MGATIITFHCTLVVSMMLLPVLLLFFSISQSECAKNAKEKNNVCSSIYDYFLSMETNPDCWHDFAVTDKPSSIIVKSGYPYREYPTVITTDGYVLTLFRIPSKLKKTRGTVFLQHGIESSGKIFISIGNESLAFLLADAGYDVWIGNYRGTEYSQQHVLLNTSTEKYWDHSIDDIALKDIPAMINWVRAHTPSNEKIIYIGHSLGTTIAMMYCSEYQKHCKENIKHFIWIGPCYKLTHIKTPFKVISHYSAEILDYATFMGLIPLASTGFRVSVRKYCTSSPFAMLLCQLIYNVFFGIRFDMRPQTIPVLINQLPAGTSLRTLNFVKYPTGGKFKKYDYGAAKNLKLYETREAPDYDISKINVSVSLYYSTGDWVTGDEDAMVLYNTLPENVRYGNNKINKPDFNHIDLLMGSSAKKLVFDRILRELNSAEPFHRRRQLYQSGQPNAASYQHYH